MSKSKRIWGSVVVIAASLFASGGSAVVIAVSLFASGCEEPEIVTQPPPGGNVRDQLRDKNEKPAEANGEGAGAEKPRILPGLVPALPTEKGETKTTLGGVKYETLKEGTGETVKAGQMITAHYVGTLEDGRKFDSSRDSGKPLEQSIGTNALIRGWDEAVPGMKVGEIRKLWVPASAGYGALGHGAVPKNADLIFEIEILKAQ